MTDLCDMQPFFEAMHRALKPGGMVCTQVIFSFHTLPAFPGHPCCLCTAASEAACTMLQQLGTLSHGTCAGLDKNNVMRQDGMPDVSGILMCTAGRELMASFRHHQVPGSHVSRGFCWWDSAVRLHYHPHISKVGASDPSERLIGCWPLLVTEILTHAPCMAPLSCNAGKDLGLFAWLCSGQIGFMVCAKQTSKDFKMNVARRTPPSDSPAGYPPLR